MARRTDSGASHTFTREVNRYDAHAPSQNTPLTHAAEAHRILEARGVQGKIVLVNA